MSNWLNFHIYYHADRDRLLREAISPLLSALYKGGLLQRFYFVRYSLGGPHIRLRLETSHTSISLVREVANAHLQHYLRMAPSSQAMSRDDVEKTNRMLLTTDPSEHDDSVYPDNFVSQFPYAPEVSRYGGEELLTHSLDLFHFTSVQALTLIRERSRQTRSEAFSGSVRLLIRLSLVLAREVVELADFWKPGSPASPASDQELQARRRLLQLLYEELSKSPDDEEWKLWSSAGINFKTAIAATPRTVSSRIVRSHLHMFANRLNLSNAVENGMASLMSGILQEQQSHWKLPRPSAPLSDWLQECCRKAFWLQNSIYDQDVGNAGDLRIR